MNKMPENPRRALGRGLGALLPPRPPAPDSLTPAAAPVTEIEVDLIDPNPVQPRRAFDDEPLRELAGSIATHGVIQPLVVRKHGNRYQLIAGERRWRAAKLAALPRVPIIVRDIPDDHLLEVSLIENVQREDLNPIELAIAFDRMARELHLGQDEIGERTKKDRTTISNAIRLLQLPDDLQQLVANRKLSPGHARCLLTLPSQALQRDLAEKIINQGWSVRQTERLTKKVTSGSSESLPPPHTDPNVKAAIQEMERVLGTRVHIVDKNGRGRIQIEYYSPEDLDRIYTTIVGDQAERA